MKKLIGLQRISCPVSDCVYADTCLYGFGVGAKTPSVDVSFGGSGLTNGFLYLVCQSYEAKRKPGRPKVEKEKKESWVRVLKNTPIKMV